MRTEERFARLVTVMD